LMMRVTEFPIGFLLVVLVQAWAPPPNLIPSCRRTSSIRQLRNIDRPELLIFASERVAADRGAARLIGEALEVGTAVVFLCTRGGQDLGGFEKVLEDSAFRTSVQIIAPKGHPPPPHPGALSALRKSLEITPDGFGGSGGFGQRAGDPPRPPLAARCVVFDDMVAGCLAARAAGMRAVAVHQAFEDVPGLEKSCDIVFATIGADEDDDDFVVFDDLYTPGSFWLNPAQPRDAQGNACDPDTGPISDFAETVSRDGTFDVEQGGELTDQSLEGPGSPGDLDEEELARVLGDLAPARRTL